MPQRHRLRCAGQHLVGHSKIVCQVLESPYLRLCLPTRCPEALQNTQTISGAGSMHLLSRFNLILYHHIALYELYYVLVVLCSTLQRWAQVFHVPLPQKLTTAERSIVHEHPPALLPTSGWLSLSLPGLQNLNPTNPAAVPATKNRSLLLSDPCTVILTISSLCDLVKTCI